MATKFWNWAEVKNEAQEEARELRINGAIAEESWFDDEVTPSQFRAELMNGKGPVTLYINSPGGDCFAASQIYTMLLEYPYDITVKVDGIAASAASVIAMAGTKVQMAATALLMIHNPSTLAYGETSDMEKAIAMLAEVKESIINAYEKKTGMQRAKISRMMDDETWMNAKRAIELGFADEIIGEQEAVNSFTFSQKTSDNTLMEHAVAKAKTEAPAVNVNALRSDLFKKQLNYKKGE